MEFAGLAKIAWLARQTACAREFATLKTLHRMEWAAFQPGGRKQSAEMGFVRWVKNASPAHRTAAALTGSIVRLKARTCQAACPNEWLCFRQNFLEFSF
jgi:hypothetical protein